MSEQNVKSESSNCILLYGHADGTHANRPAPITDAARSNFCLFNKRHQLKAKCLFNFNPFELN